MVVEFAFKGQYEKCSNGIKCGSILNWLGIEASPIYDNLAIPDEDKKDPSKLLDAFKHYFKPERNIFQSWYTLGCMYSSAFKTQSEFYHKLKSVANDCNFTNKDEIVKFIYLTHNQNTRVCEHLLNELTDTTSLADMLHMERVCEGNVHSEEISKQYLESVKTVKQVDAIHHQPNNSKNNRHNVQSQFDDSVQFEQDSIAIQFKTQMRHTNVVFDKILSTPSLQRILTDVHVKPIETSQSHWLKECFKIVGHVEI